jgi:tetratricopeptide (TPR) repeat protein
MATTGRASGWLVPLLIVGAVLLAYGGSFSVPFLFDDGPAIVANPTIRDLSSAFTPPRNGSTVAGRPLVNLSLALNYAAGGFAVAGYHVVNLLIHVLATLTLFGVVRRTLLLPGLRERFGPHASFLAAASALLWAVHPLQTESVTYIVQRAEALMGLFFLLTLYCVIRGATDSTRAGRWFTGAVAACLLGMTAKEVMATAPLLVLLYDRTFLGGSFRAAIRVRGRLYAGLAATWIVLGLLVLQTGDRGGSAGLGFGVSSWSYALTQCRAVALYLERAVWPFPLVLDYGGTVLIDGVTALPFIAVIVSLVAAAAITLWRWPRAGFPGAWFFAILAPSSSVVPLADTFFEHRVYLSLSALAVLAAIGGHVLLGRRFRLVWPLAAFALIATTALRNADYRSELAIWTDTVAKRPQNPRAHFNLGLVLARQGDRAGAIAEFTRAVQIDARNAEVHINLGNALADTDRFPEAIAALQTALSIQPHSLPAHFSLGSVLARAGQLPEAEGEFLAALRIDPGYGPALSNLGKLYLLQRRPDEAVAAYTSALHTSPTAQGHYNLANALALAGSREEAAAHYREALRLQPDFPDARHNLEQLDATPVNSPAPRAVVPPEAIAHNNRGNDLLAAGRTDDAIREFQAALQVYPAFAEARVNLGNAFVAARRIGNAIAEYRTALTLQPGYADAHFALANALAESNQLAAAIDEYRAVLRLKADDIDARNNLGNVLLMSGLVSAAIAEYEGVLRARPGDANARANLEQARALQRQSPRK